MQFSLKTPEDESWPTPRLHPEASPPPPLVSPEFYAIVLISAEPFVQSNFHLRMVFIDSLTLLPRPLYSLRSLGTTGKTSGSRFRTFSSRRLSCDSGRGKNGEAVAAWLTGSRLFKESRRHGGNWSAAGTTSAFWLVPPPIPPRRTAESVVSLYRDVSLETARVLITSSSRRIRFSQRIPTRRIV